MNEIVQKKEEGKEDCLIQFSEEEYDQITKDLKFVAGVLFLLRKTLELYEYDDFYNGFEVIEEAETRLVNIRELFS